MELVKIACRCGFEPETMEEWEEHIKTCKQPRYEEELCAKIATLREQRDKLLQVVKDAKTIIYERLGIPDQTRCHWLKEANAIQNEVEGEK